MGARQRPVIEAARECGIRPQRKLLRRSFEKTFLIPLHHPQKTYISDWFDRIIACGTYSVKSFF